MASGFMKAPPPAHKGVRTVTENSTMIGRKEDVAVVATAVLQASARALHACDLAGFVRCLADAVGVYERNPSCAQAPTSHLRDVQVYIRSARLLYEALGRPADDLMRLDQRAEALRQSIH